MIEVGYPRIIFPTGRNQHLVNVVNSIFRNMLIFKNTENIDINKIRFSSPEYSGDRIKMKVTASGKPIILTRPTWKTNPDHLRVLSMDEISYWLDKSRSLTRALHSILEAFQCYAFHNKLEFKEVTVWRQRWTRSGWIVLDLVGPKYRPEHGKVNYD